MIFFMALETYCITTPIILTWPRHHSRRLHLCSPLHDEGSHWACPNCWSHFAVQMCYSLCPCLHTHCYAHSLKKGNVYSPNQYHTYRSEQISTHKINDCCEYLFTVVLDVIICCLPINSMALFPVSETACPFYNRKWLLTHIFIPIYLM